MKKLMAMLLSVMLVLSLCACGDKDTKDEPKKVSAEMSTSEEVSTETSEEVEVSTEVSEETSTETSEEVEVSTEISEETEIGTVVSGDYDSVEDWIYNHGGAEVFDEACKQAKDMYGDMYTSVEYASVGNNLELIYVLNMTIDESQVSLYEEALAAQADTYQSAADTERTAINIYTKIPEEDITVTFTVTDNTGLILWSDTF